MICGKSRREPGGSLLFYIIVIRKKGTFLFSAGKTSLVSFY